MQTIRPFLWFDRDVEEVATFYTSIFSDAWIEHVSKSDDRIISATFHLNGMEFIAFNGGPGPEHSMAISLFVKCETQEEVDTLWEALAQGGEKLQCGWLRDQFGISWQIIPNVLGELLGDDDEVKADRVMAAMLTMTKIDIAALQAAYDG